MIKRLLILVSVVILIVVTSYALLHHSPTKINSFYNIADNIQQPYLIGNQLYFFTGSSFASLDTDTAKTTRLSNYLDTQGQITVGSWTKNSVIFSTAGTSVNDQFGEALTRAGDNNSTSHWWRYDFTTQQLQLLDFPGADNCISINEYNGSLYCFAPYLGSAHQYALTQYNINSGIVSNLLKTVDPVSSAEAENNTLYYVTTNLDESQTLHSYNLATHSNQTVFASKLDINYGFNGQNIVVDELPLTNKTPSYKGAGDSGASLTKQKLLLLNKSGAVIKQLSISSQNNSTGSVSSSNSASDITINSGDGGLYVVKNNAFVAYDLKASDVQYVWYLNNAFTYINSNNNALSTQRVAAAKSGQSFLASENSSGNPFFIGAISNLQNEAIVYDTGKDFEGNALEVDGFLRGLGYDPNQFDFNWVTASPSSFVTITDNAVILR